MFIHAAVHPYMSILPPGGWLDRLILQPSIQLPHL